MQHLSPCLHPPPPLHRVKNLQSTGITDKANGELDKSLAVPWAMGLYRALLCQGHAQPRAAPCDPEAVPEHGKGWEFCGLTYRDPSGMHGQSEPSRGGHPRPARRRSLTSSEGRRYRWTRSLSLCSRWGDVPVPTPSCGPFCSGRETHSGAGGKHRENC